MSYRSPLASVRGLGSAKEGTSHWWHQRLTAIALVPLGLWLVVSLARLDLGSHASVTAWIADPLSAVLLGLTVACLVYHSWLGIRVVIEDYVGGKASKLAGLLISSFVHVFLLAACLFSILGIAFGSG